MAHRILGTLIAAVSVCVLYLSAQGLSGGTEFAELIATGASTHGLSVDPIDFLAHWRVVGVLVAAVGLLGLVAGIAMFVLRPWSWLVVFGIASVCLLVSVGGQLAGYSRYAFEAVDPPELLVLLLVALVSIFAYRKWKRVETHASDA
jgi:hypothetical protein